MNNIANIFTMEKSMTNVKLSVESLSESKVQEISLNGTETYFKTLTMSENLCKMATKIDFLGSEVDSDNQAENDCEVTKTTSFQTPRWPWESIRNHLQQALTEINVLSDVLTITQNKGPPNNEANMTEGGKYMMFDQAKKDIATSIKVSHQLPTKKKGLNAAADILFKGEKRLRNAGEEVVPDLGYHFHLLKLRKYWRIRKVGSKVLGDLSYRTTGSDFGHPGNFEVIKATADDAEDTEFEALPYSFPQKQSSRVSQQPALRVIVGADLRTQTTVRVSIRNNRKIENPDDSPAVFNADSPITPREPDWHKTLSNAQNTLLSQELFNKLAKEAVQLKSGSTLTPFKVVGNKIGAKIFPDMEFSIELVKGSSQEKLCQSISRKSNIETLSSDIFSLKLASVKLLLDQHKKMFRIPAPHPATATFGLTKTQRKAPTTPFVLSQVQTSSATEAISIVERLVEMAKHLELKRRVCHVIDMLGNSVKDPYIQAHWSTVGNIAETTVCIVITSAGYEACSRTLVNMTVGTNNIKAVQKDGHAVCLSSNIHHIHDYLLSLLCSHQLSTVQELCNILGWTIQHFSLHSGIGPQTLFGSVGALMAASPGGNSAISIRCWIERKNCHARPEENICYEVHEQTVHSDAFEGDILNQSYQQSELSSIQNPKWSLVGGEWRQVEWMKLYGKFFVPKVESLLTFLHS